MILAVECSPLYYLMIREILGRARNKMIAIRQLIRAKLPALLFGAVLVRVTVAALVLAAGSASAEGLSPCGDGIDWKTARAFWAFRAPQPQKLPQVRMQQWPQQRLDYFVLAAMERPRLSPSRRAENRTLIRRVTFDLTGLPPTAEELQKFLSDQRPGAYERLVEGLLRSPRFGERMASLWLNVARYAEDQAHQVGEDTKNFYPNAWRYREWVIGAFNRDLAYDQFIKLQLAADKMGDDGTNQLAALGFIGLGPKYYNRDRLDVMADE